MRKYRNVKVEIDGIRFDSKKEAERYLTLKKWEEDGHITRLTLQPKYRLIPSQKFDHQENERPLDYKADFYYYDLDLDCEVVEDVKGVRTKDYVIKRKLFKYTHPKIMFREI